MLPGPTAAPFNFDPGTKANLALGNLDSRLFAEGVLAPGAVVGGNF